MKKEHIDNEPENRGVSIDDFVSTSKVTAFCAAYKPAKCEKDADDVLTDIKLRKYFQAYPRNIGDPMNIYLDLLEEKGFRLQTSISGEPAIFVCHQQMIDSHSSDMDNFLIEG